MLIRYNKRVVYTNLNDFKQFLKTLSVLFLCKQFAENLEN